MNRKTTYTVECFVPKAPNVSNDTDKWAVCHRISNYRRARAAYEKRVREQADDMWRLVSREIRETASVLEEHEPERQKASDKKSVEIVVGPKSVRRLKLTGSKKAPDAFAKMMGL